METKLEVTRSHELMSHNHLITHVW